MPDISFVKPHSLSIVKARALVQKVIDDLSGEYGLSSEWHGDTLHFHRSGVDGRGRVNDSDIGLHITLGFLVKPFKSQIVDHIERSFTSLLAEKPARKTARRET